EKGSPCPQMQIQSQARTVREGQPVTLTARIAGGDKNVTPSILWNVSAGSIRDGQGTTRIDVDSTGAGEYRAIEAELWLGGYPPECPAQSTPFRINIIPPATKLDEFGVIAIDGENEKLVLAVKAAQYGNDKVYVIGYAGRGSERMFASTALRRMRDQILRNGFPTARVGAYDGGFREQPAFEVWIVPEGAEPPKPTPTIDRKDIVLAPVTRARPASRKP
ncbi:MAG: immunoglobulin domain-containing protein, partial [Pyrinomonadaceae bacterium]